MNQRGWKPGGSVVIDSLFYNYYTASNKLLNVIDSVNDPSTKLGDFRASQLYTQSLPDGKKSSNTVDYTYEANGNLSTDRNKDMESGILYNQLQLVRYVSVKGPGGVEKGGITYTYDALGNKLQKLVQETGWPNKTTLYLGGAVYENDTLQFISHEEGRLRYAKRHFTNGDSAYQFQYDYFLKDHLGNVRMVLTEQTDTTQYLASMEAAYRTKEEQLFYNIPQTSYAKTLVPGGYPTDATTNPNDSLARTNGSGNKVGPALILKVMSGDQVDIAVKSFYRGIGAGSGTNDPLADILTSLATGIVGVAGESKGAFSSLSNAGTSPLLGALNNFRNAENTTPGDKPKAYLNWILLDEQLQYVPGSSGADLIKDTGNIYALTSGGPVTMTKNGFLYIYVSNETQNRDVFFDNLSIQHTTGPITEETHYYPFGLTMAGISSQAFKPSYAENKRGFNGNELQNKEFYDGSGLDAYDFNARTYGHQLGRFMQIDPMAGKYFSSSPYNYADGNPIVRNDPNGEDWFRDEETGDIKWQAIAGKQGEQVSLKGSKHTWTNLGSEFLVFSGDKITYYSQSTNADGNLALNSQGFDAISGAPADPGSYVDKNGYLAFEPSSVFEFDFSKERQQQANQGPTPEGLYSINKSAFKPGENEHGTQKWSEQSRFNKLKAQVGGGTWPGGTDSWGEYRWQLKSESGDTYGRKNMYLHGGTKWGSRGCIDCGNNINTIANAILTNKTGNDKVYLQVVYPKDMQIRVANGTTNNLQKQ